MRLRVLSAIALSTLTLSGSTLTAAPVGPGPNLQVTVTPPANAHVYENRRWTFTVSNIGNKPAAGVQLVIDLQRTGTSPEVYILGTVNGYSAGCTLAGNLLTCPIGSVAKGASTSRFIDVTLPYATAPIQMTGRASTTTSGEQDGANNQVTATANLLTYPLAVTTGVPLTHQHCTGRAWLTSFFECTLFPSSISEHDAQFESNGTITFPGYTGYTGQWTYTPATNRLQFWYYDTGTLVAEFDGRGVPGNCAEGKTTFPNSTGEYISMYRVCF